MTDSPPRLAHHEYAAAVRAPDTNACEVLTCHSLMWLVAGNAVGILLAVLLLAPGWGRILTPFSYGRWVTVHLDINLYGWSSLPLIGLLFAAYLPPFRRSRWGEAAVGVWSGGLLLAVMGWLTGHTSGKLFMEWSGLSRLGVAFSMAFLALALGIAYRQRLAEDVETRWLQRTKWMVLALLAVIPPLMYWSANPAHVPPINPDSGGATGGSLLGSTLAVVLIFWAAPFLLRLQASVRPAAFVPVAALLVLHMVAFALLDHGNHSHHEHVQIVALCSLVIWLPLLAAHLRRFRWPAGSRPWLAAFGAWSAILLATALATFMPGLLERWKFTNALVSHTHIAMAGMVTSFNILALLVLNRRSPLAGVFAVRPAFFLWHGGLALHATALLVAGTLESMHPDWLFHGAPAIRTCYLARLLGGTMMIAASGQWCWRALAQRATAGAAAAHADHAPPVQDYAKQGARS